jgi:methyltransferase family protein
MPGSSGVTDDKAIDLARLHRLVRRLAPSHIVELGCGFSTLAMAHALRQNGHGRIHTVDGSQRWVENLRAKIPAHLADTIDLRASGPRLVEINGQLCHVFPDLPDVRPEIIYIDGPDANDVAGERFGLSFSRKLAVSADALFYEWLLYPGAVIQIDGRHTNCAFLKANLKRQWRWRRLWIQDCTELTLMA